MGRGTVNVFFYLFWFFSFDLQIFIWETIIISGYSENEAGQGSDVMKKQVATWTLLQCGLDVQNSKA